MATYIIFTTVCLIFLIVIFEHDERNFQEALMDEVEYLAENPVDVMLMSVGEKVEGPWWHVGGETTEYVVKAPSVEAAKSLVRSTGNHEVLVAYQMR